MTTLWEAMTKVKTSTFTIRVWTQIAEDEKFDDFEHSHRIFNLVEGDCNAYSVAKKIVALENVNAVEVLSENSSGRLVYRDWP